jgi:hypothetical protein
MNSNNHFNGSLSGSNNINELEVGQYLLLPLLTTSQRDNLTPSNGMLIYNTTLNKFQGYENGAWANLI